MLMVLGGEDRDSSNSNYKDKGHEWNCSLTWETTPSPLDAPSDFISLSHLIIHLMPPHLP